MKAKGSIFRSINDFVKINHPNKYVDWKKKLPNASHTLIDTIKNTEWYPVDISLIEPTKSISKILSLDEKKCAWNSGRFSAEQGLKGIYKVFIMVSTPKFILKRAPRIITTFYDPSELKILESTNNSIYVQCKTLPVKSAIIEHRIAGWIERAGEICGCQNMKVEIKKSMALNDSELGISASWD